MDPDRRRRRWLTLLVFAIAFFYQWPRTWFTNDHFESLAKAQQMLRGELPIRDFFDNGRPLAITLSAMALRASGGSLIGEAILTMGAISAGVALLFLLTVELTSSWLLATWAALCLLTLEPRLYNYGKVLVAMGGILMAFRYADHPTTRRAAALGAIAGLGFLWRHDFGAYVAMLAAVIFVPMFRSHPRQARRDAAVAVVVGAACVLPYVWYLLDVNALGTIVEAGGTALRNAAHVTWRPFVFSGVADDIASRLNAETWLYDSFLLSPLVAGVIAMNRWRGTVRANKMAALAVLCAMLMLFLVRGNLDSRLPDVAGPALLLLAWLLSTLPRTPTARVGVIAFTAITFLAAEVLATQNPARRLLGYARRLPHSLTQPWFAMRDPVDWWESDGITDTRAVARWLRECTKPDDRVLVFGYYPDVVFFSQRPFAGGQVFLHSGYYSSPADQDLTVARMARQRVPFVVVERSDAPALDGTYSRIGGYVRAHFAEVATSTFRGPRLFTILQRKDVNATPRDDGLPCE